MVFLYLVVFCITLISWADTSSVAVAGEQVCPADDHVHAACRPVLCQPKSQTCPEVSEGTDTEELLEY